MARNTLYDSASVMYLLGALLKNPHTLGESRYILTNADFIGMHQVVFESIVDLASNQFQTIRPQDIDMDLRQYPQRYEVYKNENGFDFVSNISTLIDATFDDNKFRVHYEKVKKFTILRDFEKVGVDTKDIYNPNVSILEEEKENTKLNEIEINEIFDRIRNRINRVEDENISKNMVKSQSVGENIDELMAEIRTGSQVGFPLDGHIFNYATMGARLKRLYLYSAPTGHGKALRNNDTLPTFYNGDKKVSEIKEGDFLIGRDGKPTKVLGVYPQGELEVFEIEFADGRVAQSSADHLWTVIEGDPRYAKEKTLTLQEIIDSINGEYKNKYGAYKFKVPINKAVEWEEKELPVDPYVLGLFLGDGSFRVSDSNKALEFSTKDEEIIESIEKLTGLVAVKNSAHNYSYTFKRKKEDYNNISVGEFLQEHKELYNLYSYEKFIPIEYKRSSINQRMSIIQGLMDSNGTAYKNKAKFITTSEVLKNDFIDIIRSLGFTTSEYKDERGRGTYEVQIGAPLKNRPEFFRLKRKKNIFDLTKRSQTYKHNSIVNIKSLNTLEEMTCFAVDNEDKLFLMKDFVVTHNTRMMVGNACSLSMPYILNGEVIIKDDLQKVVFIATEMDPDEIQTLVLAYVSGVNEEKILSNIMTFEERHLVENAIEIMKEYSDNFIIEKISDPSVATLRTKVLKYVIRQQVYHVFYDYIFMSPALSTEFKSNQRDDTSLMMMANTLKEIASDYGVFIFTGTQVNREWEKRHFRNENVIAGSKAIADKIDFGAVAIKVQEEEKDEIRELLRADGITEDPNVVIDIYKNRRSRIVNMKLYRIFDYGTCRTKDLMLTDTNYHKIHDIKEIKYGYKRKGLLEMVVEGSVN